MLEKLIVLTAFCLALASFATANPITYLITVDTTSVSGTAGSLDFEFNPGPLTTQAAQLQILNFTSSGLLSSPALTGDISGTLPGTLLFDNGTGFNDYFTGFTYGSALAFNVSLFGPALATPDGTATSGSAFAFSMFSDSAGTIPALTTDTVNGFAVTVGVNLDGTTTLTDLSMQSTFAIVPEPDTLCLLGVTLAALGFFRRRMSIR